MKKEEFEQLSEIDQQAEMKACEDPVYFYNNYVRKENEPIRTADEVAELNKQMALMRERRIPAYRNTNRLYPLLPDFLKR